MMQFFMLKKKRTTNLIHLLSLLFFISTSAYSQEKYEKGAEHGHTHHHNNRFPAVILLSLCIHAFLEGMPLGLQPALLWGVSVHKIPIGLVITALLLQSNASFVPKIAALILFALMSPLGSYTALIVEIGTIKTIVEPLVVGILFHISTTILFESSEGHNFNLQKFLSILLGVGVATIF